MCDIGLISSSSVINETVRKIDMNSNNLKFFNDIDSRLVTTLEYPIFQIVKKGDKYVLDSKETDLLKELINNLDGKGKTRLFQFKPCTLLSSYSKEELYRKIENLGFTVILNENKLRFNPKYLIFPDKSNQNTDGCKLIICLTPYEKEFYKVDFISRERSIFRDEFQLSFIVSRTNVSLIIILCSFLSYIPNLPFLENNFKNRVNIINLIYSTSEKIDLQKTFCNEILKKNVL